MSNLVQAAEPEDSAEAVRDAMKRLAAHQAALSAQADRLNDCIKTFESWIGRLPGRIETYLWLPDPNPKQDPPVVFELLVCLRRDGKDWRLFYAFWEIGEAEEPELTPLREASIEIKLYVVPQLDKLVVEMAKQQQLLTERVSAAVSTFDDMAKQVGIAKEGR